LFPSKYTSDFSELTKAVKDEMGSIKEMLKGKHASDCQALIIDQREKFEDEESLKIIQWLSDLNFWKKQDDAFERAQEGTGDWLWSDPSFRSWIDGDTHVLWCPGDRMFLRFGNCY
jgi:hypothetical protein